MATLPPNVQPDAMALLARAQQTLAAGRRATARALLDAARAAGAPADALDEIDAGLLLEEGRPEAALALLGPAMARMPESWRLRCLAADARLAHGDAAGAVREAADAVIAFPREPAPKAALGTALLSLGHLTEAQACLAEAVQGNPVHVGFRLGLAHAQASACQAEAALSTLDAGTALRPQALEFRLGAIRLAAATGRHQAALDRADAARAAGAIDAAILGLRGHALSCLDRDAEAIESYREALALAPEDVYVRHLVAAAGLVAAPTRASRDYVRVLFDGFAPHFEADLIRLQYRVPGLVRRAALAHGAVGPTLDLGCGTGLIGVVLSDLPLGPLTGIDLSPAMLKEAAAKRLYDRLLAEDVESDNLGEGFGLAVAADVLPYVGEPAPLLATAARALMPGGLFIVSAESFAEDRGDSPWRLGSRARYAHRPDALRSAAQAAGFVVLSCDAELLRLDHGRPVDGVLMVLRRPAAAP